MSHLGVGVGVPWWILIYYMYYNVTLNINYVLLSMRWDPSSDINGEIQTVLLLFVQWSHFFPPDCCVNILVIMLISNALFSSLQGVSIYTVYIDFIFLSQVCHNRRKYALYIGSLLRPDIGWVLFLHAFLCLCTASEVQETPIIIRIFGKWENYQYIQTIDISSASLILNVME